MTQIRDVLHPTWSGPASGLRSGATEEKNHLPCAWRPCETKQLSGRQEWKTFQVLWQEQRQTFNQRGRVTRSCTCSELRLPKISPFLCYLSLTPLDCSYSSPSHLLYFPLSCWKLQAFWPQLTPERDWKSLKGQTDKFVLIQISSKMQNFLTPKLPNQSRLWFFQMLPALTPSPVRSLAAWSVTEKSSMHICR